MTYLFISGMFRSGTTLLSRMINTHTRVACASDPLRPLFNSFRYTAAGKKYQAQHDRFEPLADYIDQPDLLATILGADLNTPIDFPGQKLLDLIQKSARPYSGLWADSLKMPDLKDSYAQWLHHCLEHVRSIYGVSGTKDIIAFKEVWATEMVPCFHRLFENAKSLIIVRDPRDVAASKKKTENQYPFFFMARQWRKLAFLANRMAHVYPKKVKTIKYEDLVSSPESVITEICDFITVPFETELLNPLNYKDGDNLPWKQNTSYMPKEKQTINRASVGKWKTILDEQELSLIELICYDMMKKWGYSPSLSLNELLHAPVSEFKRLPQSSLAEWIRPYSFDQSLDFDAQLLFEKSRAAFLKQGSNLSDQDRLIMQTVSSGQ